MDIFTYDYEELAERIQSRLDRLTVNFLRLHGARVRRDDVDFHGFEHVDLEITHDGHTLVIRQSGRSEAEPVDDVPGEVAPDVFESTFDGQPAADTSRAFLTQWLALLPAGELAEHRESHAVDPSNPFLVDKIERESSPTVNPFLKESARSTEAANPFAPADPDKKKRAALDWLSSDN